MGMDKLKGYLKEILLTEEDIAKIVDDLAAKLNEEYRDKKEPIVVIGLLKGALLFTCDLVRKLDFPCVVDFFWASSYVGAQSTHKLNIKKDIEEDIEGKHVILLDDIVDTATSLKVILEKLREKKPLSIKSVTLLNKPSARKYDVHPDLYGKKVDDLFLVGYGMDYNELYRNLPYLAVLDETFYK